MLILAKRIWLPLHYKMQKKEVKQIYKSCDRKQDNSTNVNQTKEETFFLDNEVVKSCSNPIEIRFKALINSKCEAPFDWYKDLGLDKGNASRIRRGLTIPPKWLRIKIAHYFSVDSSTIWEIKDILNKGSDTNENN